MDHNVVFIFSNVTDIEEIIAIQSLGIPKKKFTV